MRLNKGKGPISFVSLHFITLEMEERRMSDEGNSSVHQLPFDYNVTE